MCPAYSGCLILTTFSKIVLSSHLTTGEVIEAQKDQKIPQILTSSKWEDLNPSDLLA